MSKLEQSGEATTLLRSIHDDVHSDDNTGIHGDTPDDPCERKKDSSILDPWLSTSSQRLLSYCIISIAVVAIILYLLTTSIENYQFYAADSGFPTMATLLVGTIGSILIITFVAYWSNSYIKPNRHWIFWSYLVFCIGYVLWIINLILRLEYYVKGQPIESNGSLYLIITILSALSMFIALSCNNVNLSLLMIGVIGWLLYLLYQWWYKRITANKPVIFADDVAGRYGIII